MILLTQICLIQDAKFDNITNFLCSTVSYEPLRHLADLKTSKTLVEESMKPQKYFLIWWEFLKRLETPGESVGRALNGNNIQ